MLPITTVADVEAYTGQDYTTAEETRVTTMIPWAERYVARKAGRVFYDAATPTSDASLDWRLVVAMVVERMLLQDDPEVKAVQHGPYQSEQLGDYRYTLREARAAEAALDSDPQIAELLAYYRRVSVPPLASVLLAAPSRVATPVVDADVSRRMEGGEG